MLGSNTIFGVFGLVALGLLLVFWRARRLPEIKTIGEADSLIREFADTLPSDDTTLQAIINAYWALKQPAERRAMARFVLETFGKR